MNANTRARRSPQAVLQNSFAPEMEPKEITFDANARALKTTWSTGAKDIYCINTYPNGVTFSMHQNPTSKVVDSSDPIIDETFKPSQFHLRFKDTRSYQLPEGKYFLFKENYSQSLERKLSQLHKQGRLADSVVYFGTTNDPFHALHKKFDVTMSCLNLLEQYRPGLVVVQTRSPLLISALPILKMLGDRVVVAINIESHLEASIQRYTPGQSRVGERLITAAGMRAQGIPVNLVVSPVLPYGDPYRDAWEFAELLDKHGDYISLGSLATGDLRDEAQLKTLLIAERLEADKQYRWLRPHSYRYLYFALQTMCPSKLELPMRSDRSPAQLALFAA